MTITCFAHCGAIPAEAMPLLVKAFTLIAAQRGIITDTGKAANLAEDLVHLHIRCEWSFSKLMFLYGHEDAR
jgi:hypothetical protein